MNPIPLEQYLNGYAITNQFSSIHHTNNMSNQHEEVDLQEIDSQPLVADEELSSSDDTDDNDNSNDSSDDTYDRETQQGLPHPLIPEGNLLTWKEPTNRNINWPAVSSNINIHFKEPGISDEMLHDDCDSLRGSVTFTETNEELTLICVPPQSPLLNVNINTFKHLSKISTVVKTLDNFDLPPITDYDAFKPRSDNSKLFTSFVNMSYNEILYYKDKTVYQQQIDYHFNAAKSHAAYAKEVQQLVYRNLVLTDLLRRQTECAQKAYTQHAIMAVSHLKAMDKLSTSKIPLPESQKAIDRSPPVEKEEINPLKLLYYKKQHCSKKVAHIDSML
nr:unnamed protein product [Callosobruchus chinensis]